MVLGKPEAQIAEPLAQLCECHGISQRVTRAGAFADRGKIENGQRKSSGLSGGPELAVVFVY
jgi:hypothetical protein